MKQVVKSSDEVRLDFVELSPNGKSDVQSVLIPSNKVEKTLIQLTDKAIVLALYHQY